MNDGGPENFGRNKSYNHLRVNKINASFISTTMSEISDVDGSIGVSIIGKPTLPITLKKLAAGPNIDLTDTGSEIIISNTAVSGDTLGTIHEVEITPSVSDVYIGLPDVVHIGSEANDNITDTVGNDSLLVVGPSAVSGGPHTNSLILGSSSISGVVTNSLIQNPSVNATILNSTILGNAVLPTGTFSESTLMGYGNSSSGATNMTCQLLGGLSHLSSVGTDRSTYIIGGNANMPVTSEYYNAVQGVTKTYFEAAQGVGLHLIGRPNIVLAAPVTEFKDSRPLCSEVTYPTTLSNHLTSKQYVDNLVAGVGSPASFALPDAIIDQSYVWETVFETGVEMILNDIIYISSTDKYFAIGASLTRTWESTDGGYHWSEGALGLLSSPAPYLTCAHSPTLNFTICTGLSGTARSYSTNGGVTFTNNAVLIPYAFTMIWDEVNLQFVGCFGSDVFTSPDGLTWTTYPTGLTGVSAIIHVPRTGFNNSFVAIGELGATKGIFYTDDLVTYTNGYTLAALETILRSSLAYNDSDTMTMFVTDGPGGTTIYYSLDYGHSWSPAILSPFILTQGFVYGSIDWCAKEKFFVATVQYAINNYTYQNIYSTDGIYWFTAREYNDTTYYKFYSVDRDVFSSTSHISMYNKIKREWVAVSGFHSMVGFRPYFTRDELIRRHDFVGVPSYADDYLATQWSFEGGAPNSPSSINIRFTPRSTDMYYTNVGNNQFFLRRLGIYQIDVHLVGYIEAVSQLIDNKVALLKNDDNGSTGDWYTYPNNEPSAFSPIVLPYTFMATLQNSQGVGDFRIYFEDYGFAQITNAIIRIHQIG